MNRTDERPNKAIRRESKDIMFIERDARWVHHPRHDALVIIAKVGNNNIHRMLVHNRSATDIIYLNAFNKMGLSQEYLKPVTTPFYGFTGDSLMLWGKISLLVTVGKHP